MVKSNILFNASLWINQSLHAMYWTTEVIVYVRAAAGLAGRDAVEVLSRGSDEGSRKLVVGCLLSTWLCPSSRKPDSTPCCRLCLLLSSRSFPKNASWTWQHKALVTSLCWYFPSRTVSLPFLTSFLSHRNYSDILWRLMRTNWQKWNRSSETNSHVAADLTFVSTYLPHHLYPQVIYYPQQHVTAAPCCTERLKAQRVDVSIINEMCFTVLDL